MPDMKASTLGGVRSTEFNIKIAVSTKAFLKIQFSHYAKYKTTATTKKRNSNIFACKKCAEHKKDEVQAA